MAKLTVAEKIALSKAENIQLNMLDEDGDLDVSWEYTLNDGTYKR